MVGIIEAPSRPCSARKMIMLSIFQARAHNRLVSVNPAAETANSQRVENTRVSQPLSGMTMISAIRYAVCTQLISSCAADSPPPMYCNDEATIWMSSSAMKPPKHITTNGNRLLSQALVSDIAVTPAPTLPSRASGGGSGRGWASYRR